MDTSNRVLTPVASENEIIRLRKLGKSRSEIAVAMNKGGFKTALGKPWNISNIGNQVLRLNGRGLIKLRSDGEHARKTILKASKPVKRVALKSALKSADKSAGFLTVMVRVPLSLAIRKLIEEDAAVLKVMSLK